MMFRRNSNKNSEKFDEFCEYFELGAVRRCVNFAELEKCFKIEYLIAKSGFDQEESEPSKV